MQTIIVGVVCFALGGVFWVPVWTYIKGKFFPDAKP